MISSLALDTGRIISEAEAIRGIVRGILGSRR